MSRSFRVLLCAEPSCLPAAWHAVASRARCWCLAPGRAFLPTTGKENKQVIRTDTSRKELEEAVCPQQEGAPQNTSSPQPPFSPLFVLLCLSYRPSSYPEGEVVPSFGFLKTSPAFLDNKKHREIPTKLVKSTHPPLLQRQQSCISRLFNIGHHGQPCACLRYV